MDIIQWLRDTGGKNAIQRFSSQNVQTLPKPTAQTTQSAAQKPAAEYAPSAKNLSAPTYDKAGTINGTLNNTIDFSSNLGIAAKNNITVEGQNNYVRGYNGTQKNNTINIAGNGNRILAGPNTANNTMQVTGSGNAVLFAQDAANNKLSIQGNNVKVNMGMAGGPSANNGWNIHVNANNVEVSISNGKAKVNVAETMKDRLKISIDEKTRTVSVSEIA